MERLILKLNESPQETVPSKVNICSDFTQLNSYLRTKKKSPQNLDMPQAHLASSLSCVVFS